MIYFTNEITLDVYYKNYNIPMLIEPISLEKIKNEILTSDGCFLKAKCIITNSKIALLLTNELGTKVSYMKCFYELHMDDTMYGACYIGEDLNKDFINPPNKPLFKYFKIHYII